ncbi:Acyltransferase family protein [compost metagenome]
MSTSKRLYQIDLFRFFAALCVLLYHYSTRGYAAKRASVNFPELGEVFKYGYLGVDLFFIISGFVILLSIKDSDFLNFVKSRIVRLYPAYWFCVTISFIIILVWGDPIFLEGVNFKTYLINMTMFQGGIGVKNIDGVYWTLFIELKFYIFIAMYLIINKIKSFNINYFIFFWLIISFIPLIIDFNSSIYLKAIRSIFFLHFSSYFIAGMLFYKLYSEHKNKVIYTAALLFCMLISIYNATRKEIEGSDLSPTVIAGIVVFFYAIMYLCSLGKLQFINNKSMMKLGILTYPLYLIHQNIGYIIFNNFSHILNKYVLLVIIIFIMFISAYLINILIEVPFSKYINNKLTKFIETIRPKFKSSVIKQETTDL